MSQLTDSTLSLETQTRLVELFAFPMASYWYWHADRDTRRTEDERLEARLSAFTELLIVFGDYSEALPGSELAVALPSGKVVDVRRDALAEAMAMDRQFVAERQAEDRGEHPAKLNVYNTILSSKAVAIANNGAVPQFADRDLPILSILDWTEALGDGIDSLPAVDFSQSLAVRLAMNSATRAMGQLLGRSVPDDAAAQPQEFAGVTVSVADILGVVLLRAALGVALGLFVWFVLVPIPVVGVFAVVWLVFQSVGILFWTAAGLMVATAAASNRE